MKEKTLVILAAGMGSRFGGMKQIEPVGPNKEFIIDYSVYSAIRYGFTKIIFIIKEENFDLFKETIGSRIESHVNVEYAFQKLDDIPEGFTVPDGRSKPWGTAHAIYATRDLVTSKFGVITSDDFYGDDAFKQLANHLDNFDNHVVIGYPIAKTLSPVGAVKRGVIIHEDGIIKSITESSCILEDEIICTPLDKTKDSFTVNEDQPVSMLMCGFNNSIFETIGSCMRSEFENNRDNLLDYEMLLPDIMDLEISSGKKIEVIPTASRWMGVTYRDDLDALKRHIENEIEKQVYPKVLWK